MNVTTSGPPHHPLLGNRTYRHITPHAHSVRSSNTSCFHLDGLRTILTPARSRGRLCRGARTLIYGWHFLRVRSGCLAVSYDVFGEPGGQTHLTNIPRCASQSPAAPRCGPNRSGWGKPSPTSLRPRYCYRSPSPPLFRLIESSTKKKTSTRGFA